MSVVLRWLSGVGRFWYGFIIGDDWTVAATVAEALMVTRDPLAMDAVLDKSVQILTGLHALAPATRSRTCPTPGSWPWGCVDARG